MSDSQRVLRPAPQRVWQRSPSSGRPSTPPSPVNESKDQDVSQPPSRTRSVLNLTASTLFGIYAPSDNEGNREDYILSSTPWGNGAMTPMSPASPSGPLSPEKSYVVAGAFEKSQPRRLSTYKKQSFAKAFTLGIFRVLCLFVSGMAYGLLVTHLHDDRHLAPVPVEGLHRYAWPYMLFWGSSGVALGSLLPFVDALWEEHGTNDERSLAGPGRKQEIAASGGKPEEDKPPASEASGLGAAWNPSVRGIGAFIGIGFAIRRLPWTSTLQASLTLALVNPVIWYLTDRSKPGFAVSTAVGLAGTAILLHTNIVPPPAISSQTLHTANATFFTGSSTVLPDQERFGVWVWITSVLFCSSVCFGNIGRILAREMV